MNRRAPVFDAHVDLLYAIMRDTPGRSFSEVLDGQVCPAGLSGGNVRAFVSAFYCPDTTNGLDKAVPFLRRLLEYWHSNVELPGPVRTPVDMERAWSSEGAASALFLLENADCLMDMELAEFHGLGFRLVGLTHFGRNRIADGNGVKSPEGLTPAGRRLVRDLEGLGMIIDTAHLSEPAFRQVAELTRGPLVTTHTGLRPFCDTPRNLSPEQAGIIAGRGGVIGLALAPEMLASSGVPTVEDVFVQIDWLVQRFGTAVVGLGTDFGGFSGAVPGFEDHRGLGLLPGMMERAGYPERDAAAIMGGNWCRFFRENLTA
jgi:membrane dipeptidase